MESDSSLTDLSSDLSSVGSMSPVSPALDYPSPALTQDTSISDTVEVKGKKRGSDTEEQQPPKKRKRPEPKPRRTDTLDLSNGIENVYSMQRDGYNKITRVLRKSKKIVVIAGAGISVSAGIPDFRSSTGLFKTLKGEHRLKASGKQLFDASVYQTDSSTSTFHDMVRQLSAQVNAARPTEFHEMLDSFALEGRLLRLYTQNVDGLDVNLPSLGTEVPLNRKGPWPKSIQVHGGLEKMACSKCNAIFDFESELFEGPEPPPCPRCLEADRIRTDEDGKRSHGVGRLRPRMALYNERAPDEDAIGAVMAADLRTRPDALIVVGTSLKIPGIKRLVREMCGTIRDRRDGLTVWMNMDPPPLGKEFEDCWDLVVKGPCDESVRLWKKSYPEEQSGSDTEKESKHSLAKKQMQTAASLLTPSASPPDSENENKPRIKLRISKDSITATTETNAIITTEKIKSNIPKAKSKDKRSRDKIKERVEKPKAAGMLKSRFKVTKPGGKSPKSKVAKPKKEVVSSPLSSPILPSWQPSPRSPAKSPSKVLLPSFPGLTKYSPSKLNRTFSVKGYLATPPPGQRITSSPPPYEPLSSPIRGHTLGITIPDRCASVSQPRFSGGGVSRPGSSSSLSESGTISPTSRPRGMEALID